MLELINLNKVYVNSNNVKVHALKDINLKFGEKGMTFIIGPSGGGKSTLLNVISGLDGFDSGQMLIKGVDSHQLNASALDSYRNTYVGFVFQEYNLLDHLTLAENVSLAVELQEQRPSKEEISQIFEELGIGGLENRYPNEVSGGQRQRVAIARVLIKKPAILFADEPAGSVDKDSRKYIYDTLKKLSKDILVVAVTHNADIPYIYGDRIITIDDGYVVSDEQMDGDVKFAETYGKDEVMHIAADQKLNHFDVERLKSMVESKQGKDVFVCVEDKMKAVETLHPKLAEQIKKDQAKKEAAAKKAAAAKATTAEVKEEASEPFQLIKAKLPARSAWKLAKTHFGSNKVRTIFTIVLTALAISFFAVSTILAGFNGSQANIKAFKNSSAAYLVMESNDDVFTDYTKGVKGGNDFSGISDAGKIKTYASDPGAAQVAAVRHFTNAGELTIDGNGANVNVDKFIRLSGTETSATKFGQRVVKGRLPAKTLQNGDAQETNSNYANEIVVSDYTAYEILSALNKTNLEDVLNVKLYDASNGSVEYTVVGIYETNYTTIKDTTDENLMAQLEYNIKNVYSTIYVADEFYTETVKEVVASELYQGVTFWAGTTNATQFTVKPSTDGKAHVPATGVTLKENNSLTFRVELTNPETLTSKEIASVKLTGVVADAEANTILLPTGAADGAYGDFEYIAEALTCPATQIALGRNFTVNELTDVMNAYKNATFLSTNSAEIDTFAYRFAVVGNAFLVTSILLGVFAILLLYNFVSQSVRSKRKNIGILRAIGAGMKDVFGIFMIEAALLALFILIGAYVVTIVATIIANAIVQAGALYGLTVFGFNGLIFLYMFLVAVVVSFVGYSIPLFELSRIKPIEIITRKTGV